MDDWLSTVGCWLLAVSCQLAAAFLARPARLWHIACVAETAFVCAAVLLFGLCIGSFLNVCIWRIPRNQSIVAPASRCPRCSAAIKPYDNIPVLSWVVLGGRCRNCHAPISPVYPCVEALSGGAFLACAWQFGWTLEATKWMVFLAVLIVLFFTDIFFRILPDEVNLFGAAAGLTFSFFVPVGDGSASWLASKLAGAALSTTLASFGDALLGGAVIALGLWAFAEAFSRFIGRAAMGFGDVKMMAMMGVFLGVKKAFLTLLLGTLLGSMLGLLVILALYAARWKVPVAQRAHRRRLGSESRMRWALARRYQLPLGTFLAMGAVAVVFVGSPLLAWYERLIQ